MKQTIKVIVSTPDKIQAGKFNQLFRTTFDTDSSLEYDYQTMIKGLRLLFPNKQLFIDLSLMF